MRYRSLAVVALVTAAAFPARAGDQDKSDVWTRAIAYFERQRHSSVDEFLTQARPEPLGLPARADIIASLPEEGELQPMPAEVAAIDAAGSVLQYHQRAGVVSFKVIDVGHAFIGLHERSVLLASRDALSLVSPDEFAAVVAHEIAHDYMWQNYRSAMNLNDHSTMQELELRFDGIAVLTLRRVGIDPENLVSAIQKITRFNERRGAIGTATRYVPLKERVAFIRAIAALKWN